MGIVNGIANAMGIVVPMVVALMVDGNVSFIPLEPYLCYMYCNNICMILFQFSNSIFPNFSKRLQDGEQYT